MPREPAPQKQRERTLEEVARELGLTRQRVEQIEKKAIAKCRRILTERGHVKGDLL